MRLRGFDRMVLSVLVVSMMFAGTLMFTFSDDMEESDAGYEVSSTTYDAEFYQVRNNTSLTLHMSQDGDQWRIWITTRAGGSTVGDVTLTVLGSTETYSRIRIDSLTSDNTYPMCYYDGSSSEPLQSGTTYRMYYDQDEIGAAYQYINPTSYVMRESVSCRSLTEYTYETWSRINLDANGGSYDIDYVENRLTGQTSISGNVSITLPSDIPVWDGHQFLGWSTSVDGNPVYQPGQRISLGKTTETTYYAQWELMMVTVSFDTNGGSTIDSQAIDYGGYALMPDDPELDGYVFGGWFLDNGTFLQEFDFDSPVQGNITLYTKWNEDLRFTTDPIADGTVTSLDGQPGTVNFKATTSKDYTSLVWDFGDGSTSTNTYATHFYSQPSTYTATLTVFNNHGSDTTEYIIEVPETAAGGGDNDILLYVATGILALFIGGLVIRRLV